MTQIKNHSPHLVLFKNDRFKPPFAASGHSQSTHPLPVLSIDRHDDGQSLGSGEHAFMPLLDEDEDEDEDDPAIFNNNANFVVKQIIIQKYFSCLQKEYASL